jgi:hypothetical protein
MSLAAKLSNDAVYCGFVIGQAVERRRAWMERAREHIGLRQDAKAAALAVRYARGQSRKIVEQLRLLRREARSVVTARYKHDCLACVYLGQYEDYDLYVDAGIVVARYSGNPIDYVTSYSGAATHPALVEAQRLAKERA